MLPDPSHAAAPLTAEKRRYPRAQLHYPIKLVHPDNSIHPARLCDLSLGGLSLLADGIVKSANLTIHLRLPQVDKITNQEIVLGCRLIHHTTTPDSNHCKLGMRIDEVTPSAAALIKQYLSYKLNYYLW